MDDVTTTAGTIGNTVGGGGDLRSRSGNNSVLTVNAATLPTVIDAPFNAVGTWGISVANGAATHDLVVSGGWDDGFTRRDPSAGSTRIVFVDKPKADDVLQRFKA